MSLNEYSLGNVIDNFSKARFIAIVLVILSTSLYLEQFYPETRTEKMKSDVKSRSFYIIKTSDRELPGQMELESHNHLDVPENSYEYSLANEISNFPYTIQDY